MSIPKQRRLGQVLSAPASPVGSLAGHARLLSELEARLASIVDPEVARHCRVAAFRDRKLVLAVDTPAWATRIRYHMSLICEQFRASGLEVAECRVIVVPRSEPAPEPARPRPRMGAEAAKHLESAAGGIEHGPLAAALRRLARNADR